MAQTVLLMQGTGVQPLIMELSRSHTLQLRVCLPQLKTVSATMKIEDPTCPKEDLV